ncbi:helix-turn-helix transcriptional regulator [Burkholderia gladioli]|uniref:helix-turn-helix transcriptional regulator n=1 Tax=Burkholderia gladioli TaxID=28095 RepID=UPI001640DA6E|nr:LuxR family transcriptional regulator [Burkholderia gladioli]
MDNFFAKIGQVITDSGTDNFLAGIHRLINDYVPVDVTEASNWTLDEKRRTVTAVQRLGSWGGAARRDEADAAIVGRIIDAKDSQLIHLKPRAITGEAQQAGDTVCRCILLHRQENCRYVISLYRASRHSQDFSLQELSALKQISDAILPALGHHARKKTQKPRAEMPPSIAPAPAESQAARLQRSFDERLRRIGVRLSSREYQVCLAHLRGHTLPAIARQLSVRESTAATYFRRAGIKLNLSGRHGFAKWMLGTA